MLGRLQRKHFEQPRVHGRITPLSEQRTNQPMELVVATMLRLEHGYSIEQLESMQLHKRVAVADQAGNELGATMLRRQVGDVLEQLTRGRLGKADTSAEKGMEVLGTTVFRGQFRQGIERGVERGRAWFESRQDPLQKVRATVLRAQIADGFEKEQSVRLASVEAQEPSEEIGASVLGREGIEHSVVARQKLGLGGDGTIEKLMTTVLALETPNSKKKFIA